MYNLDVTKRSNLDIDIYVHFVAATASLVQKRGVVLSLPTTFHLKLKAILCFKLLFIEICRELINVGISFFSAVYTLANIDTFML